MIYQAEEIIADSGSFTSALSIDIEVGWNIGSSLSVHDRFT
jgi:hypothetical protein